MPSHFSTIGLPVASADDMVALTERVADAVQRVPAEHGHYLHWASGVGAELWLQVGRDGDFVGVTPHFEGRSSFRAMVTADVVRADDTPLEGAVSALANPVDDRSDSGDYPFVFDVDDRGRYGGLVFPFASDIKLCAFAHELHIYESEQEYHARCPGDLKFAAESFIPSGMFLPGGIDVDPPRSEAIFTGRVLEAAALTNPLTGASFHWALVKTLGGQIDLVADPALVSSPIVTGGILSGSLWLCGRILEPRRRGGLLRLLRRNRG